MKRLKNCGRCEYYVNIGTALKPKYRYKGITIKGMWAHEAGIGISDWNNDGQQDLLLMNGDNGNLLLYNKFFLDKLEPQSYIQEIKFYNK